MLGWGRSEDRRLRRGRRARGCGPIRPFRTWLRAYQARRLIRAGFVKMNTVGSQAATCVTIKAMAIGQYAQGGLAAGLAHRVQRSL